MTSSGSKKTSPPIARTSIFVRIFQTLKMTILGSFKTSPFIPRTSFLVQKFKQFYVCISSHLCTKSFLLFRTVCKSPWYGRRRIQISNLECITQLNTRPFYRRATFSIDVVENLTSFPFSFVTMCVSNIFGWSITIRHNLLPLRSLFTCMVVVGTFFFLRRFFFFFDDMFELKKRKKRTQCKFQEKKRKKYASSSLSFSTRFRSTPSTVDVKARSPRALNSF